MKPDRLPNRTKKGARISRHRFIQLLWRDYEASRSAQAARTARPAAATPNIVALAASDPQLSTLVSLVKKAGLVSALSGKTKLTVFAPTNAAFAAVPKATLTKLGKDKALLIKVLEYHVVPGVYDAAAVEKLTSAKTLEGQTVKIKVKGGDVFVNSAEVVKANLKASNGIVHVINGVLLPS
jgi:uncharacterized surface protein with fasciclin (FAS1) repeats